MDQMLESGLDNSSQDVDEQPAEGDDNEDDDQSWRRRRRSEPAEDASGQLFDSSAQLQYQFKAENGQVTYRVVQVDGNEQHVVAPIVSPAQSAVAQAIIAHAGNPFGGSTAAGDGPFYVMMAPQEVVGGQRTTRSKAGDGRVARDEKRRATHNEVERRRRDKINNWIVKLSKVVPDCQADHTKQGQSKGGILAKATEYIQELCMENTRLADTLKENEALSNELDAVRQQFVDAKNENRRLRQLLARHGIPFDDQ